MYSEEQDVGRWWNHHRRHIMEVSPKLAGVVEAVLLIMDEEVEDSGLHFIRSKHLILLL